MDKPRYPVGVVGAGTMGAGIAQVALTAGFPVTLFDVTAPALEAGRERIQHGLSKLAEKGRLDGTVDEVAARLAPTRSLRDLAEARLVIEAAPESLDLKGELFRELDALCGPETVLASNTSSFSITRLAAFTERPDRFVGLHFFNPAPLMALVEVIAGQRTDQGALELAHTFAQACGKTPVLTQDTPGFILNRVNRAFYGEALRLLTDGVANFEAIDRIVRGGGGFRMGPFELLDLIGLDVNLAVTESVSAAFYDEPRFRPMPMQRRMVEAGLLGRKSGKGFYDYGADS
jgi:3-hydroxybutyryl-CoA dehydrogenase